MSLLNICLYGHALDSNAQVGNELLMDEVIGKTTSMKSVKAYVQDYDKYLPLDIAVLERRLVCNVDVSTITSTYELEVRTDNEDDKD